MNMTESIGNPPEFIFHYTRFDSFLEIAKSGAFRLGPLQKTNDPYERENFYLDGSDRHLPGEEVKSANRYAELDMEWSKLRDRYQILCGYSENHPQFFAGRSKIDGRTHLPMWAHYGQNHQGVCLVINRERFTESIKRVADNVFSGFVKYDQLHGDRWRQMHELPRGFWSTPNATDLVRDHVRINHQGLFFQKSPEWREEAEWRWVVDDWRSGHLDVPIDYSLESVVVGSKIVENEGYDPVQIQKIVSSLGAPSIEEVFWNVEKAGMDFK